MNALLAGCRDDTHVRRVGRIDTLPNGAIVVHNPSVGLWTRATQWRVAEDLRIGAPDGAAPLLFGVVYGLAVGPSGEIFVLEGQAQEIRVFDARGVFIRVIGRKGAGPGELKHAIGATWSPTGDLWVVDVGNARYTVFDTSGRLLNDVPRTVGVNRTHIPWPGGFDSVGHLFEVGSAADDPFQIAVIRTGLDLGRYDTLRLPAPPQRRIPIPGGFTIDPASPRPIWCFDRRGLVWFAVNDRYRVYRLNSGGDTTLIVEREWTPSKVRPRERDRALTWRMGVEDARSKPPIPRVRPAIAGLLVDDEENLWVRRTSLWEPPADVFDVFDPAGFYLGEVRTEFKVTFPAAIVGGSLYAGTVDDSGVVYVVRAKVIKPGESKSR